MARQSRVTFQVGLTPISELSWILHRAQKLELGVIFRVGVLLVKLGRNFMPQELRAGEGDSFFTWPTTSHSLHGLEMVTFHLPNVFSPVFTSSDLGVLQDRP